MYGYPENRESTVGHLRRARVDKIDDSGAQQIMKKLQGLASERPEDVYRAQGHGLSSHPPAGSEGLFLALGGRSDRIIGLGFEHKKFRPKDTPEGGIALYNHTGDIVRVFKDKLDAVHSKLINIKVGKGQEISDQGSSAAQGDDDINISIVLKAGQALTVTYDDTSLKLESGKATLTSPHVVVKSDHVDLGDEGGTPIGLCGGGCATKVFAV